MNFQKVSFLLLCSLHGIVANLAAQEPIMGTGVSLIGSASVWAELGLTPRQSARMFDLKKAVAGRQKSLFEDVSRLGFPDPERRLRDAERDAEEEILRVSGSFLTSFQIVRLRQLWLQTRGLEAFLEPRLQEALSLTKGQIQSIQSIKNAVGHRASELSRSSPFEPGPEATERMRQTAMNEVLKLLTEPQMRVWRKLIGSPFSLAPQVFREERGNMNTKLPSPPLPSRELPGTESP